MSTQMPETGFTAVLTVRVSRDGGTEIPDAVEDTIGTDTIDVEAIDIVGVTPDINDVAVEVEIEGATEDGGVDVTEIEDRLGSTFGVTVDSVDGRR